MKAPTERPSPRRAKRTRTTRVAHGACPPTGETPIARSWLLAAATAVGKALLENLLVPVFSRLARMPLEYLVRPVWAVCRRLGGGGDGQ
jgi:hypothetical protein